jgi:uncharacterized protein
MDVICDHKTSGGVMKIWIDFSNSPHVQFFRPLIREFINSGHTVEITSRDFAQTVEMAKLAGISTDVIGNHGGKKISSKISNLVKRSQDLIRWARKREFDLAVSHNSYTQLVAARTLQIPAVTLMDYEYQPANHLAFRAAKRVIVPEVFPEKALVRCGAANGKVRRYRGFKEDVYLADFIPDPEFRKSLCEFGIGPEESIVTVRPPAYFALYHRMENPLFDLLLKRLLENDRRRVVILPRNFEQKEMILSTYRNFTRLVIPERALDGSNLIYASDMVVSAGGTMNREACALGVPAVSIYAGRWAAVDQELVRQKRLVRIEKQNDLENLPLEMERVPVRRSSLRKEVAELILEAI